MNPEEGVLSWKRARSACHSSSLSNFNYGRFGTFFLKVSLRDTNSSIILVTLGCLAVSVSSSWLPSALVAVSHVPFPTVIFYCSISHSQSRLKDGVHNHNHIKSPIVTREFYSGRFR